MILFNRRSIIALACSSWFPSSTSTTTACEPTRRPHGHDAAPDAPLKLTASTGQVDRAMPASHDAFDPHLDNIVR